MAPLKGSDANDLATLFNEFSQAVDDFRLSFEPPLAPSQMARLKDESQALEDRAHYFTAEAIGPTLESLQSDLASVKAVTAQAKAQLSGLNDVAKGITIATSVLSLGTAIAAGDPTTILAATQALGGVLR
jgi:hypothetical protein